MKRKNLISIIILLIIIIGTYIIFSKESRLKRYVYEEYGINSSIISKEKKSNGDIEYSMINKENNIRFTCNRYKDDFELDNTKFFSYKTTKCDYYKMLTKSLHNKIVEVQDKYNVIFNSVNSELIDEVIINNDNIEGKIDNVTKAVNELMKLYDLKKNVKEEIFIVLNNEYTDYCYSYTMNGKVTKVHNSSTEFYEKNEINKEMVEQVINYINKKYSVEAALDGISVSSPIVNTNPTIYENVTVTLIDSNNNFKIEVTVDKEKYNKDKNNNVLSEINNYITNEMKYSS